MQLIHYILIVVGATNTLVVVSYGLLGDNVVNDDGGDTRPSVILTHVVDILVNRLSNTKIPINGNGVLAMPIANAHGVHAGAHDGVDDTQDTNAA